MIMTPLGAISKTLVIVMYYNYLYSAINSCSIETNGSGVCESRGLVHTLCKFNMKILNKLNSLEKLLYSLLILIIIYFDISSY